MKQKHFLSRALSIGLLGALATVASAQVDHLLLSELGISASNQDAGVSSEYVEIFNPTENPISLDNYYLCDNNLYKTFPSASGGLLALGTTDNLVRFPSGHTLQPGQVAVVCGGAQNFLAEFFSGQPSSAYFSLAGNPLLFEIGETDGTVPNMTAHNSNATQPLAWSLTNPSATNGEFMVLFHWDGASDLVQDVDIVCWGNQISGTNMFAAKTTSDTGANGTPYLADAGSHASMTLGFGFSMIYRTSIVEVNEAGSGGNGLTGHDETTEQIPSTWATGTLAANRSPGTTELPTTAVNSAPLVTSAERDIEWPSSSQAIKISATAVDVDGTLTSVKVFYTDGATFTSVNATLESGNTYSANIGPFADGKIIKYYVEATDNQSAVTTNPPDAPTGFKVFTISNNPVVDGDIVFNEILEDTSGGDTYEFVELYNNRNEEVDLSYYRFADANTLWYTLPEGTKIPAGGYVVLTQQEDAFWAKYPDVPSGTTVLDWGTFALNNSGPETIYLAHPNGFEFNGVNTYIDEVTYLGNTEGYDPTPWPANGADRSHELINPGLDNSNGANWLGSVDPFPSGTPGWKNTQYRVFDITDVNRAIVDPAASTAFQVTAKVTGIVPGITPAAVELFYDAGSGTFAPVAMTATANPDEYAATIPGQTNGTVVKYYVQAKSAADETETFPATAPAKHFTVIIGPRNAVSGDVVINEILYDNEGADLYEFVELHNPTGQAIDLSYYLFGDGENRPFIFPQGTSIAANGYIVITENEFNFTGKYNVISAPLFSWNDEFGLGNGGDRLWVAHPNEYQFKVPTTAMEVVQYDDLAPWPTWPGGNGDINHPDAPNMTGRTLELISPLFGDRGTNGERWAWTLNTPEPAEPNVRGTPGAQNSVYQSSVPDWSIY